MLSQLAIWRAEVSAGPALDMSAGISTGEAARRCGISRHTLLRAARRGDLLPAWCTPGGHLRFRAADVETFAARLALHAAAAGVLSPVEPRRLVAMALRLDRLVELSQDLM